MTKMREPKRFYQCDVCGVTGHWEQYNWTRYASLLLDEECPWDVPCACSDDCTKVMKQKLDSGEWVLPKISWSGRVTQKRRGY